MQADVEVYRIADVPSRRPLWLVMFGAVAAVAFAAWAIESSILLPASVIDRYDALSVALYDWAAAYLPSTALPLARIYGQLLLSPLLYLGLAAVMIAERLAPADQHQEPVSRGMIHDGIAWYLFDTPLKIFLYTAYLGGLYWVFENAQLPRLDWHMMPSVPTWALLVLSIVASDFLRWIHHYLSHKIPFLWHFHSVHHSQRELNLFTQSRFHFVDVATQIPVLYAPLYMLSLNFELAAWTLVLTDWYGRLTHANLRTNYGLFRYALVTPQSHRIHHSCERRHIDTNFGILFSFWDRLFGTQWPNDEEYPATGIADEQFPWETSVRGTSVLSNYVAQLIYPFRQLFSRRR